MADPWYQKLQDLPKIASVVVVDAGLGTVTPDASGKKLLLLQQTGEALVSAALIIVLTGYLFARPIIASQVRKGGRTVSGGHAEVLQKQSLLLNVEVNVDNSSLLGQWILKYLSRHEEPHLVIETTPDFAITLSFDQTGAARVVRASPHRLQLKLDRSMRNGTVAAVRIDAAGEVIGTDHVDVTWTTTLLRKRKNGSWRPTRWARVRSNLAQVTVRSQ